MEIRTAVLSRLICPLSFLFLCANAEAEDRSEQILKGIALIKQTADMYCGKLSESGYSLKGNASGEINATVARLFKMLADAKVSLSAGAAASTYAGVLQSDLAADRKDTRNCSQLVLKTLLPIVLGEPAYQPVSGRPQPNPKRQLAVKPRTSEPKLEPIEPQSCGNDVWYLESKETPGTYSPMYVWRCSTSTARNTDTRGSGITINDKLEMDRNRGQLQIEWAGISVNWSTGNLLLTASLKNPGSSTVHVRSIDIIAKSGDPKNLALPFFSHNFVIFPSEKVLVPVAEVDTLAKLVDQHYNNTDYVYTVSMDPLSVSRSGRDELVTCSGETMGFGLSVAFDDIFGDQYRLNRPAFVNKNKCITSPITYLDQQSPADLH